MRKAIKMMVIAGFITMAMGITAQAGEWKHDAVGWWYQADDGSYPQNGWMWIDGNQDGVSECYYFDNRGYCLMNAVAPEGYMVNGDGAWVANGQVQTRENTQTTKKTLYTMKEAEKMVIEYYYAQDPEPNGTYVISPNETTVKEGKYLFVVRWQMSDEEAARRIREGIDLAANIYAGTAIFNRRTGEIQIEW